MWNSPECWLDKDNHSRTVESELAESRPVESRFAESRPVENLASRSLVSRNLALRISPRGISPRKSSLAEPLSVREISPLWSFFFFFSSHMDPQLSFPLLSVKNDTITHICTHITFNFMGGESQRGEAVGPPRTTYHRGRARELPRPTQGPPSARRRRRGPE